MALLCQIKWVPFWIVKLSILRAYSAPGQWSLNFSIALFRNSQNPGAQPFFGLGKKDDKNFIMKPANCYSVHQISTTEVLEPCVTHYNPSRTFGNSQQREKILSGRILSNQTNVCPKIVHQRIYFRFHFRGSKVWQTIWANGRDELYRQKPMSLMGFCMIAGYKQNN